MFDAERKIFVSSANMINLTESVPQLTKSFTKMIKNRGSRTDPWGTPIETGNKLEHVLASYVTYCFLLQR